MSAPFIAGQRVRLIRDLPRLPIGTVGEVDFVLPDGRVSIILPPNPWNGLCDQLTIHPEYIR